MQDIRQSSASNDFSSIMRPFYYHCSHLNIHKHIHRKTKSTISFTVKKIKNSASNYQPQPGEPQQEVFHSLEFQAVSNGEKKCSSFFCGKQESYSKHTGHDEQTQATPPCYQIGEHNYRRKIVLSATSLLPIVKLDGLKPAQLGLPELTAYFSVCKSQRQEEEM